jgi:hypothetical protein
VCPRRCVTPGGSSRSATSSWPRPAAKPTTSSSRRASRRSGWSSAPRSRARRGAQPTKTVDDADAQARRLRLECEDYIDHKLAEFEVVLERTRQAVENGRAQLQVSIDPLEPEDPEDTESGFFDQDET